MENYLINKNIAYFIGVLHSDGSIYVFNDKKRNRKQIRLNLTVGKKSLEMSKKFQYILKRYFNKTVNIRKKPNHNSYIIQTSINKTWHIFSEWTKYNIPNEIKNNKKLFNSYLAGLIDGDGHIKIKNNTDRKIPQCLIRISSDRKLEEIKKLITKHNNCMVHFYCCKKSKCVDTCFYFSKKNYNEIINQILPNLAIKKKQSRLLYYKSLIMSLPGFEPGSFGVFQKRMSEAEGAIQAIPQAHNLIQKSFH